MAGKPKSPKDQFAVAKDRVEKLESRPSKDDAMKAYVALVAKLGAAQG